MEKVVEALADENTNVYSNLSKITLALKPNGVFLEDKNYKISILVNRRRSRRCFLKDGDILDMGELTLVFHSPESDYESSENKKQKSNHLIPRVRRAQGKLIRNIPTLIPTDARKKTFFLTKNVSFIGRSESNDLVPKARAVSLRHSKIELVAGRYKISDLGSVNGTFVNGKRSDSRLLRDGDEVAFESVKYTFSLSGKTR
ncbi:MAG: FHA domain-containing protein [Proteobacteria bacterium]|nr:FHA domain-containing protein [Pseudomonadota bacterium]